MCAAAVVALAVIAAGASRVDAAPPEADGHAADAGHATTPAGHAAASDPAGAGGHAAAHEEGVPLNLKLDLAFWSLIVFLVFLTVLRLAAWGPLSDGLNRREARIRDEIAAAEEARNKAEQMLVEHARKLDKVQDEVREILAEARRDADYTKQDIVATAQREAEATKQRAVSEINRARDQALNELFDVMASRVATATEHVLGRSLDGSDQDRLIEEALSQMSAGHQRFERG
jgi:F-type H+-transporting ATPase subunit b